MFVFQASSLVKECMQYLESGTSPACLRFSVLKAFEERFRDFSAQHFEKKTEALLERHPDGICMWNAVWAQCRDIRQRLGEILQASYRNQSPPTSPQKENVATKHANGLLESLAQNVITTSTPEKREGDPQTNPDGGHTENQNCHTETLVLLNVPFKPVQCTLSNSETQVDENKDTLSIKQHVQGIESLPVKEQSSPKVWLKDSSRPFHRRSSEGNVSTYHKVQTAAIKKCPQINSHSDGDLRSVGRPDEIYRSARYRSLISSCSEASCASTSCSVSTKKDNSTVTPMTQTFTNSCQEDFLPRASSPVSDAESASCDGQSSNLSHQDSFCSSVSQPSRSNRAKINKKFSDDIKSMSSSTHSVIPVETQDGSISTPTVETNSTVL